MKRSSRSGRLLHGRRRVSTRRPMHLTKRIKQGLPSLRSGEVRALFKELLGGAKERGLHVVAYALMGQHIHLITLVDSPEALGHATRYLFGQLARRLNKLWGRKGRVFVERFFSRCCTNVRQAFNALSYVLRNPAAAAVFEPDYRGWDRYVGVDEAVLGESAFLHSVVGPTPSVWRPLLWQMVRRAAVFVPIAERLQCRLPGS